MEVDEYIGAGWTIDEQLFRGINVSLYKMLYINTVNL